MNSEADLGVQQEGGLEGLGTWLGSFTEASTEEAPGQVRALSAHRGWSCSPAISLLHVGPAGPSGKHGQGGEINQREAHEAVSALPRRGTGLPLSLCFQPSLSCCRLLPILRLSKLPASSTCHVPAPHSTMLSSTLDSLVLCLAKAQPQDPSPYTQSSEIVGAPQRVAFEAPQYQVQPPSLPSGSCPSLPSSWPRAHHRQWGPLPRVLPAPAASTEPPGWHGECRGSK